MKTRHLAVMLTDIKEFTDLTARKSREQMRRLLEEHNELLPPVIERFHGHVVKTIGDAFLVTFESSTDAVLCGIAIQKVLAGYNRGRAADDRIDVRIAINVGEVAIADDGDIFGDAVNITSRIEGIAVAGEVFFTEAVYLAMNKQEVPSSEIGYRQFKGVPEPIKLYKVLQEDPVKSESAEEEPPKESRKEDSAEETEEGIDLPGKAGGISGMMLGMMGKLGMKDIDIEDGEGGSKKVRVSKDEIHVIKDGKEIRITKDGIKIRRPKKKGG